MMTLGLFEALDDVFDGLEEFVADHFDNPLLWIAIVCMLLVITATAINTLSK